MPAVALTVHVSSLPAMEAVLLGVTDATLSTAVTFVTALVLLKLVYSSLTSTLSA